MTDEKRKLLVEDMKNLHNLTLMNLNQMDRILSVNSDDVIEGYDTYEEAKVDLLGMFQKMINSIHNHRPMRTEQAERLTGRAVVPPEDMFDPDTSTYEERDAWLENYHKEQNEKIRKEVDGKPLAERRGHFPQGEDINDC